MPSGEVWQLFARTGASCASPNKDPSINGNFCSLVYLLVGITVVEGRALLWPQNVGRFIPGVKIFRTKGAQK
jgi:hypothetical protein